MSQRGREVAHRLFAAEFEDSTYSYTESDEERAPKYIISPSGARVNRLFVVGVLTAVDRVNEDTLRARVVDPTGAFVVYASQYQPDARAELESIDPPAFVAITGKANTFRPDGADRVYSSVRPEAVAVVDADTRDRWTVNTAERSLVRLGQLANALSSGIAATEGVDLAISEYDPSPGYVAALFETCVDALRLVAGEIETIESVELNLQASDSPEYSLEEIAAVGSAIGGESPGGEFDPPSGPDEPVREPETERSEPDEGPPEADTPPTTEEVDEELPGTNEPTEPVLSDEERDSIEAEFGGGFTTGDEVKSAPDSAPEEPDDQASEQADGSPTDQMVDLLRALNGNEGVDHDTLIDEAAERLGFDAETVEDALEGAMMEGRCYESDTDVYKPI